MCVSLFLTQSLLAWVRLSEPLLSLSVPLSGLIGVFVGPGISLAQVVPVCVMAAHWSLAERCVVILF